jgi:beta-1,4-mannosyltransferase
MKKSTWLISLVRWYEKLFARCAWGSLCVTKSMKYFLSSEFSLSNVHTLYDRPGPQFSGRSSPAQKAQLEKDLIESGLLTNPLSHYTFIVASSTSWTPDEDFSILLAALPGVETFLRDRDERMLLCITGKGECRESFVTEFEKLYLSSIRLVTAWLPAKDYPIILGLADVGISLHTSTSGLDLPMKAVDMLGAECPVLALEFPALVELLGTGGGATFSDAIGLEKRLISLLSSPNERMKMKYFASEWRKRNWKTEWDRVVLPLVDSVLSS